MNVDSAVTSGCSGTAFLLVQAGRVTARMNPLVTAESFFRPLAEPTARERPLRLEPVFNDRRTPRSRFPMAQSSAPNESRLIAELNDLLQLDHDAVEAYTIAIDLVRNARYRELLVEYRADHKRHIEEIAALVRARGGLPTELPHATAPLKLAVQALGAAPGDVTLLLAFKAVEGQAR